MYYLLVLLKQPCILLWQIHCHWCHSYLSDNSNSVTLVQNPWYRELTCTASRTIPSPFFSSHLLLTSLLLLPTVSGSKVTLVYQPINLQKVHIQINTGHRKIRYVLAWYVQNSFKHVSIYFNMYKIKTNIVQSYSKMSWQSLSLMVKSILERHHLNVVSRHLQKFPN